MKKAEVKILLLRKAFVINCFAKHLTFLSTKIYDLRILYKQLPNRGYFAVLR